jgi:hypothetical protein
VKIPLVGRGDGGRLPDSNSQPTGELLHHAEPGDYTAVELNRLRHQVGLDDRTPAETYAASPAA